MRLKNITALFVIGFILSGFSFLYEPKELEALNKVNPVGSPFSQQLTKEYRTLSNYLYDNGFDFSDAVHFARKGLSVVDGEDVFPEPVVDWDLTKPQIAELSAARSRLIRAITAGARNILPEQTATAQVRFDCWIEEAEEGNFNTDCKSQFEELLPQLENAAGSTQIADRYDDRPRQPQVPLSPFPEPVNASNASNEPLDVAEALYLIFFDFDSSNIRSEARDVVDALVNEIAPLNLSKINIVGHADTTGSEQYNKRLGLKRAQAVKDALIARGISPATITVDTRGEDELLVPTADGVREPANRRSVVTFVE